jgi:O-succinylbenzoate synthase
MFIERAELIRIPLKMRFPFETGSGSFQQKDALLVCLYDENGLVGYGESGVLPTPFYTSEYIDSAQHVLREFILPRIVGKTFERVQDLEKSYEWIKGA